MRANSKPILMLVNLKTQLKTKHRLQTTTKEKIYFGWTFQTLNNLPNFFYYSIFINFLISTKSSSSLPEWAFWKRLKWRFEPFFH